MVQFFTIAVVLISAYLLGSIPTALFISRRTKRVDIRCVGDGNMGAHNTFHEIGPKFGVMVAVVDFTKGALAVFLAYRLGLHLSWQIIAAISAILGHDFPLFANFKGGQGTATSFGTMLVLFPLPTLIGLAVYGIAFLIIKNSNVGCGIGGATIAIILGLSQQWLLFGYTVIAFIFIPVKLLIDSPRRRAIRTTKGV
jgi:acyl phosphate:glycerol-3-phosphate acyltransferase